MDIGEALREARAARGIELSDAQQATKIRIKYLRAMEEDAWDVLPGPAYARGFLRTYATFLGLEADALVWEYRRRYEEAEEPAPQAEPSLQRSPRAETRRPVDRRWALGGLGAAALVGILLVLGLTGGSGNGGGHGRGGADRQARTAGGSSTTTSAGARGSAPAAVSLRLRSSGTVWVCLLGDRDRALVNGLTLGAGESRGPYRASAFQVTFGNGDVQMEVNAKPFRVPQVAEPIGYRITSQAVRPLSPTARPTCT